MPSKFSSLLATRGEEPEEEEKPASKGGAGKKRPPEAPEAPPEPAAGKKRGRPPGKRTDPAYEQVTAYLRRDTYAEVKIRLIREGRRQEFSDLLEELLTGWLNDRPSEGKNSK